MDELRTIAAALTFAFLGICWVIVNALRNRPPEAPKCEHKWEDMTGTQDGEGVHTERYSKVQSCFVYVIARQCAKCGEIKGFEI